MPRSTPGAGDFRALLRTPARTAQLATPSRVSSGSATVSNDAVQELRHELHLQRLESENEDLRSQVRCGRSDRWFRFTRFSIGNQRPTELSEFRQVINLRSSDAMTVQECAAARRQIVELTNELERTRVEAASSARLAYELQTNLERLKGEHEQALATAKEDRALFSELTQALHHKTNEIRSAVSQISAKEAELSELGGQFDGQVLELLRLRRENSELRECLFVQSTAPRTHEGLGGRR